MNRRTFLQLAGYLSLGATSLSAYGIQSIKKNIRSRNVFNELPLNYESIDPSKVPQIIYIFLYGGPSELAANLTNIEDIMVNSQNTYPAIFSPDNAESIVTPNHLWSEAGGSIMESLLASNKMSIYRTMSRTGELSRAHGQSITQNLVGNRDTSLPGIGTNLANIIFNNNPFASEKPIEDLSLPFVSFEGESLAFKPTDQVLPSALSPISLSPNLINPFIRKTNIDIPEGSNDSLIIDDLASRIAEQNNLFPDILSALKQREKLAQKLDTILSKDVVNTSIANYNARLSANEKQINYPNENFGQRLKAATSLALANKESMFISVGSGGLGGWDDHSESLEKFPNRMQALMNAIDASLRHIELASRFPEDPTYEHRPNANNIIIKVHGEFGRNVSLNNARGWDHGNNQNLFTFGGTNIRPQNTLGKIVGETMRIGNSKENRQYTSPNTNSYQFEPYALSSSIYRYFGLMNPELLTGHVAIDEQQEGIPLNVG